MPGGYVIAPRQVGELIAALRRRGHRVVGPTRRDGAIVYDEVRGLADLPVGWDDALFGYAVGAHSWKQELLPRREVLWTATRTGSGGFRVAETPHPPGRLAFLGVRACELAAIAIQDRVLIHGLATDTSYAARRADVALIAVNCGEPAATCFCGSMGTGPRVVDGADLVLTELLDDGPHELHLEAMTDLGRRLVGDLDPRPATATDEARARAVVQRAAGRMGRTLDAESVHDLLLDNLDHPQWDDVASRCLSCTNCTLVCPTCFCTEAEDLTSLNGDTAQHVRRWDSCFGLEFSHVAPGSVRSSARSRYRQWMTHKLATWIDQFGTSGCVGCGRCITWCPVGIDITEEAAAIAAQPNQEVPT